MIAIYFKSETHLDAWFQVIHNRCVIHCIINPI